MRFLLMTYHQGKTVRYFFLLAFLIASSHGLALAQGIETKWDVTQPRGHTREISFSTSEGTWMSVDLSPDGQWIVFDLLAHIYRVPVEGGQAECLTQNSGIAVNLEPRISPDGKQIAFVSDRNGQNNLWVMNADGSNTRLIYDDKDGNVVEPVWTPDGMHIIARRLDSRARDSMPSFVSGLWIYPASGGAGVEIIRPEVRAEWPSVSPDGRWVYFQGLTPSCPGSFRRRDVVQGCYQLRRLDLKTNAIEDMSGAEVAQLFQRGTPGGALAPEISPDGHLLAFVRRIPDGTISYKGQKFGPRSALWLRDLNSGSERILVDPVEQDMGEAIHHDRVAPGYSWAHDSKSIVFSQGGKIRRVDIQSGQVQTIPFTATVHRTISEMSYFAKKVSDGPFEAKYIRWQTVSPDGRKLAFQAVGRIWIMDLPDGKPRRLTSDSFLPMEYSPAWSPDGKSIAFASWDDVEGGQVWKIPATGGMPTQLTRQAGEYLNPAWSPDGTQLVVTRGSGETFRGRTWASNPWYEVVKIPASGGSPEFLVRIDPIVDPPQDRGDVVQATFGPENRVFYLSQTTGIKAGKKVPFVDFTSIKLDGTDKRVHLRFPPINAAAMTKDGKWVAFEAGDNVYLMPFRWDAQPAALPEVDRNSTQFQVKQLSHTGGLFPHWHNDTTLEFGSSNRFVSYQVDSGKEQALTINLSVPRALPSGTVALTGARIVTLDHKKVIERGTIIVKGGRIACVGECDTKGMDRVIPVDGKTIIPGLIDMHAHHHQQEMGVIPAHDWEQVIYLAYGVTTTFDPAGWSAVVFPTAEMIDSGAVLGPRTYSTGDVVVRGDGLHQNDITNYDAAEQEVERRLSWGATSIKEYLQARRIQRQWLEASTQKFGSMITAEAGIDLPLKLSLAMDGYPTSEHALPFAPLYSDVAKFLGQAHMSYSPTLMVGGPSPWDEEYWFQESDLWKNDKLRRFLPWQWLLEHTREHVYRPPTDYGFAMMAQGVADIIAEGGYGSIGSHGQQHGLGSHWEIWMLASALSPMDALEVATVHGAHSLGFESDLGSIEVGKLADLVVLNSNPLENIRNTTDILYTMKAGTLYQASTMDEIWPVAKPFGKYYWVNPDALRSDDRPVNYWDQPKQK